MKKLILILPFFLLLVISPTIKAGENALVLSPIKTELSLSPGGKSSGSFQVSNNYSFDLDLDLKLAKQEGDMILETSNVAEWLQLEETNFQLAANSSHTFNFEVDVPSTARDGSFDFLIISQIKTSESYPTSYDTYLGVDSGIAHIVSINVYTGEVNINLTINKFELDQRWIYQKEILVTSEIFNNSNRSTKPLGYFQISNPKGTIIINQVLNEQLVSLEPKGSKSFDTTAEINLWDIGTIGKYKCVLKIVDPDYGFTTTKSFNFYIIPYPVYITVGLVIFVTLILMFKNVPFGKGQRLKSDSYK